LILILPPNSNSAEARKTYNPWVMLFYIPHLEQ
jgi:hypothetical protein